MRANTTTTFTATGTTDSIDLKSGETAAFSVTGGATATWSAQRSLDGGTTWGNLEDADGNSSYTADKEVDYDTKINCKVRVNVSAYTSGTLTALIRTGRTINA